jgi:diguanylate cyclase (GGDEF)-like protein/PAS domain S-box-containing protein
MERQRVGTSAPEFSQTPISENGGRSLGSHDIAERKAFLDLGAGDCERLTRLHALIEAEKTSFSEAFYDHLLSFEPLRRMMPDDQSLAKLRESQSAYFSRLTSGEYHDEYVVNRLRVGQAHQRIGLEPKWYIGAYRKYLSGMMQLIWKASGGDAQCFLESYDSLLKVVLFDIGLALESYFEAEHKNLQELRDYADQIIYTMPNGLLVLDAELRLRTINPAAREMLELDDKESLEGHLLSHIISDPALDLAAQQVLAARRTSHSLVIKSPGKPLGRILIAALSTTMIDKVPALIIQLVDETESKLAEESLKLAYRALEASGNGIIITDTRKTDNPVVYVNPAFERITGYTETETIGRNCRFLHDQERDQPGIHQLRHAVNTGQEARVLLHNFRKDGSPFWNELLVAPVRTEDGSISHYVGVQNDVTEQKRADESLLHLATHDSLTGLPNRILLRDRISQSINQSQRTGRQLAVLFIDVDRFKIINDSLGHLVGDMMIAAVGNRLRNSVRMVDTVARVGGDEFVVVLTDIHRDADIIQILPNLSKTIADPITVDEHTLHVTASMGISVYPRDGRDLTTLLKHADIAMYQAKEAGRNTFRFYTSDMNANAVDRLHLEIDLRKAIGRNELLVHYQPQVEFDSGRIIAAEALARWQHPQKGLIPPGDFIPLAEESGMIVPIGEWVLREVCAQIKVWRKAGAVHPKVAINLSPSQFHQANLVEMFEQALKDFEIPADALELEITEGTLMHNPAEAATVLHALNQMGFKLAVDDFGTGYSSLAYLKRFPLHALKIDRSFIQDIETNRDSAAIAAAVISLAHNLGLKVVAEGVEDVNQMERLHGLECDFAQGYLYGRPMPAEELLAFIAQPHPQPSG